MLTLNKPICMSGATKPAPDSRYEGRLEGKPLDLRCSGGKKQRWQKASLGLRTPSEMLAGGGPVGILGEVLALSAGQLLG